MKLGKRDMTYTTRTWPDASVLLFADDIALLSDTIVGLQNQSIIMWIIAKKSHLVVNINNSSVRALKSGGFIAKRENWLCDKRQLQIVNMYKYLGLLLSMRCFHPCTSRLFFWRSRWCYRYTQSTLLLSKSMFSLFEAQIQNILLHNSEVWGLNADIIKNVHLFIMKKLIMSRHREVSHVLPFKHTGLDKYVLFHRNKKLLVLTNLSTFTKQKKMTHTCI